MFFPKYFFLIGFLILPSVGALDFSFLALGGGAIVFLVLSGFKELRFSKPIVVFILLTLILWIITFLLFFWHGGSHVVAEFIFKPARMLLVALALVVISILARVDSDDALKVVFWAAAINALVVYAQYTLHFLDITDSFLLNPNTGSNALTPYRKPGLMAGFPVAGLLSVIGSVIASYLYLTTRNKIYIYGHLFVGLTCVLTARTALYLFLLVSLPYFLVCCKKAKNYRVIFIFISGLAYGGFSLATSDNQFIQGTVNKMFANVISYMESGSAYDYSTVDLVENHYSLPQEDTVVLFGTSLPHDLSPVNSDVSVFRIAWYGGVPLAVYYVLLFLYVGVVGFLCARKDQRVVFTIIFGVLCVANLKGAYLFSRVLGDLLLMIFVAFVCRRMSRTS